MMGISFRHYILPADGSLRRVPLRVAQALPFGKDAIPEFAGTRQRIAAALIENEAGKPVRILDVTGSYWEFDDEGKIDNGLRRISADWINFAFASPKTKKDQAVVDLVPELKKKELHDRHRWLITTDLVDLIAADIWPGVHGPAPEVTMAKGVRPKTPP